jgi:hypothetical protein
MKPKTVHDIYLEALVMQREGLSDARVCQCRHAMELGRRKPTGLPRPAHSEAAAT